MSGESVKQWGVAPLFDPSEGVTVMEPPGEGQGYWVGGCSAIYDPNVEKFYLYYRVRKPIAEGRGGQCHIAESSDGVSFTNIWTATGIRVRWACPSAPRRGTKPSLRT